MKESFLALAKQRDDLDEGALQDLFQAELTGEKHVPEMFADTADEFSGEELVTVCSEIVATIKAECNADDFHNWDYDHLEFIIDLSNRYGFTIPRNLLNGLPEQLIILVDAKKLGEPGCD